MKLTSNYLRLGTLMLLLAFSVVGQTQSDALYGYHTSDSLQVVVGRINWQVMPTFTSTQPKENELQVLVKSTKSVDQVPKFLVSVVMKNTDSGFVTVVADLVTHEPGMYYQMFRLTLYRGWEPISVVVTEWGGKDSSVVVAKAH